MWEVFEKDEKKKKEKKMSNRVSTRSSHLEATISWSGSESKERKKQEG
jgi:hypothetical protein